MILAQLAICASSEDKNAPDNWLKEIRRLDPDYKNKNNKVFFFSEFTRSIFPSEVRSTFFVPGTSQVYHHDGMSFDYFDRMASRLLTNHVFSVRLVAV